MSESSEESNARHTPGPWGFNDYGEITCGPEDDQLRIAEMAPWEKQHIPEMTANARLIATSPRMGEMLLRLRDHLICGDPTEGEILLRETEQVLFDAGLDEPLPKVEGK